MTNTRIPNRRGRHLVLVDIENLVAAPNPTASEVQVVIAGLRRVVRGFEHAQQVVACSHFAALSSSFAFPTARHLWKSGTNGADLALLDVLENERIDERFEHVTICSGDGIFAASAARLAATAVEVSVVSLRGHLAARLQLAARNVAYLVPPVAPAASASAS